MNLHVGEVREGTESKRVKVHAPLPVDAKGHKPDYKKDDLGHGDINSSLWNGSHKYEHWLRLEGAVATPALAWVRQFLTRLSYLQGRRQQRVRAGTSR